MNRRMKGWLLAALLVAVCACGREEKVSDREAAAPPESAASSLVDARYPIASAGDPGWDYAFAAQADLDGDGADERIVLVANVEVLHGEPAWDDGQVWQAYVLEPDGARTTVYLQYVQLGEVTAALSLSPPDDQPAILLTETTGAGLRVFEIRYLGPDRAEARRLLERTTAGPFQPLRRDS